MQGSNVSVASYDVMGADGKIKHVPKRRFIRRSKSVFLAMKSHISAQRISSKLPHHEKTGHHVKKNTNEFGQRVLHLKEDFYAATFVAMKKDIALKFNISNKQQGRNFFAILWIWITELTLIAIILKSVVFDKPHFEIVTPNAGVYVTRFLASMLMHMELIEMVKQGMDMILYLNTHPEQFEGFTIPFLCGFLQCTGGLAAESMNLFMLATRSQIELCITFFVAFHVLNAVDGIYAESICELDILEVLEEPLIFSRKPKEITFKSRDWSNKVLYVVWKIMNFVYISVYYYYFPFIINFVPYFFAAPASNLEAQGSNGH